MKLGIVSDEVSKDLRVAAEWAKARKISRFELRNVWGNRLPDVSKDQLTEIKTMLNHYGIIVTGISPGTYKCALHEPDFASQPERLVDLADRILLSWRGYTDEAAMILAETDGEPHNTITPIARRRGEDYELDLVLRNNLTTPEHPLAVCDNDLSDVKMIFCAPDLPGAMEWISWLVTQGVVPMIAYTEGTTEQMYEAADRGARIVDHFYNGLPLMDHHFSGSTVGLLLDKRLYLQMTCDGVHVAKPFIDLAIRCKGVEKIIPVSDSSKYVGMPEGVYEDNGKTVIFKDGAVRSPEGKLVTGANPYDADHETLGILHGGYWYHVYRECRSVF